MTRRRLIFCLIAFLFVTLSLLFFAQIHSTTIQRFAPFYSQSVPSSNTSTEKEYLIGSNCYLTESVEIIETCRKCTAFERRSQAIGCSPSGFKELVLCSTSQTKTFRSCPIPANIQKHQFWLFEFVIFLIGLASIATVHYRQKTLDKQMVEKIKRQIGENDQ